MTSLGFSSMDIINHNSQQQYRNYSESRIKCFVEMFRIAFRKTPQEPKYSCIDGTIHTLVFILSSICLCINQIPYHHSVNFSPAEVLYPTARMQFLLEENLENMTNEKFMKQFASLYRQMIKCRNEIIVKTLASNSVLQQKLHDGGKILDIKPNPNDVALAVFGANGERTELCRIVKLIDDNTAEVRFHNRIISFPIVKLKVIYPAIPDAVVSEDVDKISKFSETRKKLRKRLDDMTAEALENAKRDAKKDMERRQKILSKMSKARARAAARSSRQSSDQPLPGSHPEPESEPVAPQ